jgi:hypothetical protein
MNSVNASTGFSGFQIRMGQSPRIIPPLVLGTGTKETSETCAACSIISQIEADVAEAKDALIGAKVMQAFFTNKNHGCEDTYCINDRVMLATLHRHCEFKAGNKSRVAKFFPCWDGPFTVTKSFPETSSYGLALPNLPNVFPTYHASLLKRHNKNNASLFPSRELE